MLFVPRDISAHPGAALREGSLPGDVSPETLGLRRLATCKKARFVHGAFSSDEGVFPLFINRDEDTYVAPVNEGFTCLSIFTDGRILETTNARQYWRLYGLVPRSLRAGGYLLERHRDMDLRDVYARHIERIRRLSPASAMTEESGGPSVSLFGAALTRALTMTALHLVLWSWIAFVLGTLGGLASYVLLLASTGVEAFVFAICVGVLTWIVARNVPWSLCWLPRSCPNELLRRFTSPRSKKRRRIGFFRWVSDDLLEVRTTREIESTIPPEWIAIFATLLMIVPAACEFDGRVLAGVLSIILLVWILVSIRRKEHFLLRVSKDTIECETRRGSQVIHAGQHPRSSLIGGLVELLSLPNGRHCTHPFAVSLMLDDPALPLLLEVYRTSSAEEARLDSDMLRDRLGISLHDQLPVKLV